MSAPTKRTPARKRGAGPRPVPVPPAISKEEAQQQRVERLITVDQPEAIKALTDALGQAHQTIVINSVLINRLINHILAIDPDDTLAQQVQQELEEEQS